jgi:hypothetical protein
MRLPCRRLKAAADHGRGPDAAISCRVRLDARPNTALIAELHALRGKDKCRVALQHYSPAQLSKRGSHASQVPTKRYVVRSDGSASYVDAALLMAGTPVTPHAVATPVTATLRAAASSDSAPASAVERARNAASRHEEGRASMRHYMERVAELEKQVADAQALPRWQRYPGAQYGTALSPCLRYEKIKGTVAVAFLTPFKNSEVFEAFHGCVAYLLEAASLYRAPDFRHAIRRASNHGAGVVRALVYAAAGESEDEAGASGGAGDSRCSASAAAGSATAAAGAVGQVAAPAPAPVFTPGTTSAAGRALSCGGSVAPARLGASASSHPAATRPFGGIGGGGGRATKHQPIHGAHRAGCQRECETTEAGRCAARP